MAVCSLYTGVLFAGMLVVASRDRVDMAAVNVEHPCDGAIESGRRTATATKSTVRATHLVRLMTRTLHRLGHLQHTYVRCCVMSVHVLVLV